MTRSAPPSPLELSGRRRCCLLLVRRVLGEQAVLHRLGFANPLLATCDLPHHVVQVAEGVSLPLRQALHLHVGHEQDVRAHARLAAALAAAHEVEWVFTTTSALQTSAISANLLTPLGAIPA